MAMVASAGRMPRTRVARTAPQVRPEVRPARLTRRGRVAVVLGVLLLLVVGFSMGYAPTQATDTPPVHAPRTVTVQAGESLWALAQRIAPRMDPRLVVAQIESLNHLAGPQVMAGQQLLVPVAR